MQVTAAWGYVGCGNEAVSAPAFSIGWAKGTDQHLNNCPSGWATEWHQYVMQIAFDEYVTGQWYFLIYDETSQSYVLSPDYISSITGTYFSTYENLGVIMEGSNSNVDGTWIPSGGLGFSNLLYWDAGGTNYHWVHSPLNIYTSPGQPVPSNVNLLVSWTSNPVYVSAVSWADCGGGCYAPRA